MVLSGGFKKTKEMYACLYRAHSLVEETVTSCVLSSDGRATEIWGHHGH